MAQSTKSLVIVIVCVSSQVFGRDSDEEDMDDSQGGRESGKSAAMEPDEDEFDFIVDDHGQPIRKRKEDGTYVEP